MELADRYGPWAVVAGASEGVGLAFARRLAQAGLPSVLVGRRPDALQAAAAQIRTETGIECATAAVDLAAPDAVENLLTAVGDREVGLYVANAGADTNHSRFLDAPAGAWADLVRLNVLTTVGAVHHFAGAMRERGRGGVLLVNSGACYGGAGFMSGYSASKAFLLNFAESLWVELQPHGVDVLTVVLGKVDTPAYRALLAETGMPLPTDWAHPDDIARSGLERLPHGPVHNMGSTDDTTGFAPTSPDSRRARALAVTAAAASTFGS